MSWPLSARAELIGLDQLFKPKEQVTYFEVYHIAHETTSHRTAIPLSEVISPSSQGYVRVSERNWRAVNALYDAFSKTGIDRGQECAFNGMRVVEIARGFRAYATDGSGQQRS